MATNQKYIKIYKNTLSHPTTSHAEILQMIFVGQNEAWRKVQLNECAPGLFKDYQLERNQQPEA